MLSGIIQAKRRYILYDYLFKILKIANSSIVTESRSVVAWGKKGRWERSQKGKMILLGFIILIVVIVS